MYRGRGEMNQKAAPCERTPPLNPCCQNGLAGPDGQLDLLQRVAEYKLIASKRITAPDIQIDALGVLSKEWSDPTTPKVVCVWPRFRNRQLRPEPEVNRRCVVGTARFFRIAWSRLGCYPEPALIESAMNLDVREDHLKRIQLLQQAHVLPGIRSQKALQGGRRQLRPFPVQAIGLGEVASRAGQSPPERTSR
jgi:hypothetical protein